MTTPAPASQSQVFDPGLQPERTALAWRRTALSITVGALAGTRLLGPDLGWGSILIGAIGVLFGLYVHASSGARYNLVHSHLIGAQDHPDMPPDASLLLAVAIAAGILGLLSAAFILLG